MTSFSKQSQVTSLPPTLGIKDAETRAFLDALVNAWDLRSGNTRQEDAERFVTLGEINKLTNRALKQAFSGGVIGGANGGTSSSNPTEAEIGDLIDNLVDSIRKSILYQLLETQLKPIDLQNLKSKIDASIGEIGAKIIQEQEIRSTADEAFVNQLQIVVGRVAGSEAAIAQELTVRASKDNALARAINTMWAAVGNNQAVIEDGQLATAGSVAAQATKWNQVVASVTDPNTGQINAASIKQELTAYANAADGKFNAIYSVRAQVDVGGRTIVGGFGLAAMSGATSGSGPTIDFGVRADRFYIAATADSGSVANQMAPNLNSMPFIVVTSPQYYDGILYQPGVYMKTAMIADATIGTAKIADASITNAKIQNASIDTLKVASGSVTSMAYGSGGFRAVAASSNVWLCSCTVNMPSGASGVVVSGTVTSGPTGTESTGWLRLLRADGIQIGFAAYSMIAASQFGAMVVGFDPSPPVGNATYWLIIENPADGPGGNSGINVQVSAITATGGKR